jgi:hypothetical protein
MYRLSATMAAYLIRLDTEYKGHPLTMEEAECHCDILRKIRGIYTLHNGDIISYHDHSWRVTHL